MAQQTLTARTSPIGVGDVAPDFTLVDQDRKEWTLSEAVKKGDVVLAFVPFAFTGVCTTEMKCVTSDMANWTGKGMSVVGISCDSFAANKAWSEQEGYTHPILSDLKREVCKAYGLYWADLNVAQRGTAVIGKDASGRGKVKHVEARDPSAAMNWKHVLEKI
ncbi:MAG: redoxin domain-containing protein [Phycisphaerales bacterium]